VATGYVGSCAVLDYDCLCDKQRYVLACYENCPSGQSKPPIEAALPYLEVPPLTFIQFQDPHRPFAEQKRIKYCNAAKAYGQGHEL
jgi:hypothetical protein